jgi:hypothetical protein
LERLGLLLLLARLAEGQMQTRAVVPMVAQAQMWVLGLA